MERKRAGPSQVTETAARSASGQAAERVGNAISTIMVTYHTGPVLFQAIDSLVSQHGLCDLIIVDNGNPPDLVAELEQRVAAHSRLFLLTGHGNVGFAAGCNLGARRAHGEILLLLNPDCLMPPGGLRELLDEAARLSRPWMLGCRLVNPDGSEQRGTRREILTPWVGLVEALRLDRLAPHHPYLKRLNQTGEVAPEETTAVPVISGACMMLPAEDYWALGGMDEGYFLHVEDIDFCYRFDRSGGEIFYVPHVEVTHYRSTSDAGPMFIEWHKARGFIRYFRKNFVGIYSPMFLTVVNAGILARFAIKACVILVSGLIGRNSRRRRSASPSD